MTFDEILDQAIAMLQRRRRVSYRALKRQFALDEAYLEDLKHEIITVHRLAVDQDGEMLVWAGDIASALSPEASASSHERAPLTYTPSHLTEKILASRTALEGERKQVTVLFADLKGSMELLADRDPEEARQLLDPVLERLMAAVHRYEGTVNQVMGDGIMALFGAPLAHEDHAVRACYAALAMQEAIGRYAEELRRQQGLDVQIRVGLHSGEVVVRAIGSDLHMDYTAVGQTTHLAARLEQLARPGTALLTADTPTRRLYCTAEETSGTRHLAAAPAPRCLRSCGSGASGLPVAAVTEHGGKIPFEIPILSRRLASSLRTESGVSRGHRSLLFSAVTSFRD